MNNGITFDRIKKALSLRTLLIILLITAFLTTIFYITIENRERKDILIWHITDESETLISAEKLKSINEYAVLEGFDKLIFTRRDPSDEYFDAAMSTTAYYNCDIFIMTEKMALRFAESNMFLPISADGYAKEDILLFGDTAIGLPIDNNYYLLINAKTTVDTEVIYEIYDILTGK